MAASDEGHASSGTDAQSQDNEHTLPIHTTASTPGRHTPTNDPMDLSPTSKPDMGPPNGNTNGLKSASKNDAADRPSPAPPAGAAAAAQQPKVVQTAFIHKLYNMLEDQNIQHLITWSSSNESFLICPSTDFSKVLSTYFKHTNVSSFVRQLNMYGFHKVSDVFQTGSPDTPLWEFKHGAGNFKRGDLNGLREIKRRASRHTLINRESFSAAPKPPVLLQQVAPEAQQDTLETRLNILEQNLYDVHTRLARSEEVNAFMTARCQDMNEKLFKSYQYNNELSGILTKIVEDPEHPAHQQATSMQRDIGRQLENIRISDSSHSAFVSRTLDNRAGYSPTLTPYDERRRASVQTLPRQNFFRPLAPSPRRPGSIGAANTPPPSASAYPTSTMPSGQGASSQFGQRTQIPAMETNTPPMPRRHTSADIHSNEWLQAEQQRRQDSIFSNTSSTTPYLQNTIPNPNTLSNNGPDQQLRDSLARYSLSGGANTTVSSGQKRGSVSHQSSRGSSPPPHLAPPETSWSTPPKVRLPFKDVWKTSGVGSQSSSGPPTRRGSVANIQSMLNPADTTEADNEDEMDDGDEARKRKRLA